jgi:hypothetical protein
MRSFFGPPGDFLIRQHQLIGLRHVTVLSWLKIFGTIGLTVSLTKEGTQRDMR